MVLGVTFRRKCFRFRILPGCIPHGRPLELQARANGGQWLKIGFDMVGKSAVAGLKELGLELATGV